MGRTRVWLGWVCAVACVVASGCATVSHASRVRAEAESRLVSCLGWNVRARPSLAQKKQCVDESKAFCRENGLEATCGVSGLWTRASSFSRR